MRRSEFIDYDPIFELAAEKAVINRSISIQDLQESFNLGISRAELVLKQLEASRIIGPKDGDSNKALVDSIEELESILGEPVYEAGPVYEDCETSQSPINTKSSPQYSDSVNAMNGCLGAMGQVFAYTMVILLLLCTAPAIIMILLFWWIIAWILGLIFPGKEFFPIKKIWDSVSRWTKEKLNVDLGSAAIAAGIIMVLTAIFGGGSSKKD